MVKLICLGLAAVSWVGCTAERLVAREVLADPLMRFEPDRAVLAPGGAEPRRDDPLPTDTIQLGVRAAGEPGDQIQATWLTSDLRAAVELAAGFGVEAGYGLELEHQRLFQVDGFAAGLDFERLRHGPEAALVYDDGTSVLRAGYRYRTAFDGDLHEPSVSARTLVLGSDTVVELGYRRTMTAVHVGPEDHPADLPVDSDWTADRVHLALEQGFLPGINLRLDVVGLLEGGFLQNPYQRVTLWSHWPPPGADPPDAAPQTVPEHHPASRSRWGALLRTRFAIPAWSAALELGAGHGSGTWRVEHSQVRLAWLQRLGQWFRFELGGGAYHQTRASFYRDDYPAGPVGAYWSADRALSSYWCWWSDLGFEFGLIPERGRLLGMFKYLNLQLGIEVLRADYNFEGLGSNNGFTDYAALADPAGRQRMAGGWQFSGGFGMVAGF